MESLENAADVGRGCRGGEEILGVASETRDVSCP